MYWGIPFLGTRLKGYKVSECPHFAFTEPCSGAQHIATGLMELELQGDRKPGVLVTWVGEMKYPAGSCPLIGRNKLQFYPSDREMVTRIGEQGCCYL